MHVISMRPLREFWETPGNERFEPPLRNWYKLMERQWWETFADIRATFPSADQVGRCTVFNVSGNHLRVIVRVEMVTHKVYVRAVLSHEEYDDGAWRERHGCV